MDLPDTQELPERLVSPDHVPWSKKRKTMIIRLVAVRLPVQGTNAAITTSRHIHTDDKVNGRIEQPALSHQPGPPFSRIAVGGQRMEDPYNIITCPVQPSLRGILQVIG